MDSEVLPKKAKKLELKALEKRKISSALVFALESLLHDVYVHRHPKPSDYFHRNDLVRVFNAIAKEIWGKNNGFPVVEEYGSFLMDMFSVQSDLDLSVNFSKNAIEFPRKKKIQALRKFAKKLCNLQGRGHVSGVQPILTARVPIVKVKDCGTGIECDISVENRDGIAKSHIIRMISTIDERFRKLSFLMKDWAKAHKINSSKDKTLSSFSIISLVAFHLQTRAPPILPPFSALFKDGTDPASVMTNVQNFLDYGRNNKESLAELFVTLLAKLASVEALWPKGLCASTFEGSWIFKTWNSHVGCISIEDFTERSQNVARAVGTVQVKTIYTCIHRSVDYLMTFKDGQIEGHKLRELLFGPYPIPSPQGKCINKFDNNETGWPVIVDPIQTKKKKISGRWEGTQRAFGETKGWGGTQRDYAKIPCSSTPSFAPFPYQAPPFVSNIGNGVFHGPIDVPPIHRAKSIGFKRSFGSLEIPSAHLNKSIGFEGSFGPPEIPHAHMHESVGFEGSFGPLPPPPSVSLQNPLGFDGSDRMKLVVPMPYVGASYAQHGQRHLYPNHGQRPFVRH